MFGYANNYTQIMSGKSNGRSVCDKIKDGTITVNFFDGKNTCKRIVKIQKEATGKNTHQSVKD